MVHHKHYPNLGSDTSTMQNFCASSSGVISPGQPVFAPPSFWNGNGTFTIFAIYLLLSFYIFAICKEQIWANPLFRPVTWRVWGGESWRYHSMGSQGELARRLRARSSFRSSEIVRCSTLGLQPSFRSHLTLALDLLWLKRKIRDCSQSIRSMDPPLVIQSPLPLIP